MTNDTKQWLLQTGWKHFTLTQLAEKTNESTATLTGLFRQHDIKPITHRDLVTSKLLDIYLSPECKCIDDAAALCECSTRLINEINEEWQLGIPSKMEYKRLLTEKNEKEKSDQKKSGFLQGGVQEYVNTLLAGDNKKIKRVTGVYSQSGSEILDSVRGIKTTQRPNTLLSNKKK